ncbi:3-deoxy-D-manno-octulosonic acid transferase [Puniceibacterium sediminis]|uniref:3-deoxy-D-manno-octulosonic acid transferase n=1 Tax=Puniceibacterium sediminis TaxID=1608407 RepID=A0A238WWT7_9RHOB|nr:glycosyltransferase N-terminal domain-containing protein [Puniceibacterium sediminis]SNR50992.1 3-deoxy-D-manno-octulosonic-acid transferase [Puniceibacterium sediminis]
MGLYRVLITLFALWQMARLALARDWSALAQRRGTVLPDNAGPHLWLHAASNGELASARPLLLALRAARADLGVLITCNSATGVALAKSWGLPGLSAHLAPLDLTRFVRRVMRHWQIVAHVTMEAEIWPNRVLLCPGPVMVLGGRMSEGSARGWGYAKRLARRVLARIAFLSAQDTGSRDRFLKLGLRAESCGPVVDLKALYAPPPEQVPDEALRNAYPRASTWLAASTHVGEEQVVIEAHLEARKARPDLRLILALRHPSRAEEVAGLLRAAGLTFGRRSLGDSGAEVLLADTMGEMALWYALAGVVFIGGTLTDRGGHTPYEPTFFGAAILHGPDLRNFQKPFAVLKKAGAAQEISDAAALAAALVALKDPARQRDMGTQAQAALRQDTGLEGLMERILSLLPKS